MKNKFIYLLLIGGLFAVSSCTPPDENVVTAVDRQFVESAAMRNRLDGQIGQIARTRATADEVRRFGDMLLRQNAITAQEIQDLAKEKEVTITSVLPASMQEKVDQLVNTPEADFNVAFLTMIVESRQQVISLYEQQIKKGNDNELRIWASSKMSNLHQEKERAAKLKASYALVRQ